MLVRELMLQTRLLVLPARFDDGQYVSPPHRRGDRKQCLPGQESPLPLARGTSLMSEISRKILCVDDDPKVIESLQLQLGQNHEISIARGHEQGLDLVAREGPFALVISNYSLPGINGAEFLRRVHELSPETVAVLLTGRAELDVAVSALHGGRIFRFLKKPCPPEVLDQAVRDSLEQYELLASARLLTSRLNQASEQLRIMTANLEVRVQERTATIQRLYRFVSELNGMDSIEEVAELVVETAARTLDSRRVTLLRPTADWRELTILASRGLDEHVARRLRLPVHGSFAGELFARSRTQRIDRLEDIAVNPIDELDHECFWQAPMMCAWLGHSAVSVGLLHVADRMDGMPYTDDNLVTLTAIAEAASIALQNQIRLEERNAARDATILALARLAEHRDPETGTHLERVQAYCRLISETLAATAKYKPIIDRRFIDNIVRCSPLHDIGKVGIPDRILLKPGRLTPEEFEIMKTHATIGGDTIRSLIKPGHSLSYLTMGMEIAYYHHEKYDGTGYPRGLAGEDIPLPARILAVADVYDALSSKRVYKQAMSHEDAMGILLRDAGTHFDPDVVAAFSACHEQIRRLAKELRELETPPIVSAASSDAGSEVELALV